MLTGHEGHDASIQQSFMDSTFQRTRRDESGFADLLLTLRAFLSLQMG